MEYKKKEISPKSDKSNENASSDSEEWNELLCWSDNHSSEKTEQLSSEEVADLWAKINLNLSSFN